MEQNSVSTMSDVRHRREEADRTLLIMRHCKSDWDHGDPDDFLRPLSRRGIRNAREMGTFLRRADLRPDMIIASPAARTRRTAEIVAEQCRYRGTITWEQSFYTAEPASYLEVLTMLPEHVSRPLIVGHNPAIEQTILHLTGGHVRLQTGAMVRLDPGTEMNPLWRWADLAPRRCTMRWLVAPRLLATLR